MIYLTDFYLVGTCKINFCNGPNSNTKQHANLSDMIVYITSYKTNYLAAQ